MKPFKAVLFHSDISEYANVEDIVCGYTLTVPVVIDTLYPARTLEIFQE